MGRKPSREIVPVEELQAAAGPFPPGAGERARYQSLDRLLPHTLVSGRYRIERRIGRGGFGRVFAAEDIQLTQRRALKFLDPAFTADPRELLRVRREILLSRRIGDPRIVQVLSLECWQGIHYLVMELVEGQSLSQVIEANGALPWKTVAPFFIQVLEALAALHEGGIVHRDIKPGNIMVGPEGRVRLLDFGLAREVWEPEGSSPRGEIVGSPYYLSPEQIQGGALDGRSDLYQLGLVLYRLLAGRHPFAGTTPMGLVVKHLSASPPALKRPAVPGWVEAMLERLLQKRPERRFASAREVLRFLQRADRSPIRRLLAGLGRHRTRRLLAILGTLLSLGALLLARRVLGR